ncbi:MAG: ribonuclease H-like domain-containing protein [Saprospiraceae bacterium]|jgi:DNA polymerase elongation subunit (family B)|nr:ribonuclease H-like domain-containing protein [Saprospiraceae bacterium]MBK7797311.1 ribonuclease H-like domain-containing protein [Saprospiraceae bacterium]MBK9377797.1 ribonuclease H-like domain-containing protein [Saprospiraceae bacterium]MBL0261596.1 ribonuclease H-like domain-containing protein [Saprospiraceae bacterium]
MTALDKILFLDIETVSQFRTYDELDERWQKLWDHKCKSFHVPDKSTDELYAQKAAIYSEFGKILCIGLAFERNGEVRTKAIIGEDESSVLQEFFGIVNQHFARPESNAFSGHNIKEFDIPYICRRAMIHQLELPLILQIGGKKPWEVKYLYDTIEQWKFGDQKSYVSLDLLAACLGLESSKGKMDGSMVGHYYWNEADLNSIAEYCLEDVLLSMKVYKRIFAPDQH